MIKNIPTQIRRFILLGAISGDVIGSAYGFGRQKRYDFPLFTPASAIAGTISEVFYGGMPDEIATEVCQRVPDKLWDVLEVFSRKYASSGKEDIQGEITG